MLATALDSFLNRPNGAAAGWPGDTRIVETRAGRIRVRDTGGQGPAIVMTPDGPNVIEHHAEVIELLAPHARVVCFDMPGFGFSRPGARYGHTLAQGSAAILAVMDALDIREAALAFSCANGFYAIAAAKQAPQRIRRLLLAQTPGYSAMPAWTKRNVPVPIQLPVVGQALNRAARYKLAHAWYGIAMPDKPERARFRATARHALDHGACFCLASVVQGLSRAQRDELSGVQAPATLLWGDSDRSHKYTKAESLLELLPQAQIHHRPDCGHFPELEQPRSYAELALAAVAA
jgi:pimeloyl-ACP methyl ester carboxylesterase